MLTGRQIREARELLNLSHSELATRIRLVRVTTIRQAEADDPWPPIDAVHLAAIRQTLETLGVDFAPDRVRLREPEA